MHKYLTCLIISRRGIFSTTGGVGRVWKQFYSSSSSWNSEKTSHQFSSGTATTATADERRHQSTTGTGILNRSIEESRSSTTAYCVQLVKKHDYDNFLATLLIPDARIRTGVFALRAFNCEIAIIRDQVTQENVGLGRFVFWKDAIRQLFKIRTTQTKNGETIPRHPVIQELSRTTLTAENISQKWFQNLIECREQVMNDHPFGTLLELEKYSDQSVTSIFYLAFEFMNAKIVNLDHCASHLGKAIGLTNFIRGLPYNAQRRRVLVPQELIIKHKVSQESFLRFDEPIKIRDVVYEIATSAHLHYEKAKSLREVLQKDLKSCQNGTNPLPVFLSALPSQIYLRNLEKHNFNPYEPKLLKRNALLPWQLYYKKWTKLYY